MHSPTADGTAASIMTAPIRTIPADTPVVEALRMAETLGLHHLPLLDSDRLIGLVCTCDLQELGLNQPVRRGLRRELVTLDRDCSWGDVVRTMSRELVGSVLVTEEGRAVGIVTREDLSRAGVDVVDVANFRCDSCGGATHLKRDEGKGLLCLDCRTRATPESPLDETGVVD